MSAKSHETGGDDPERDCVELFYGARRGDPGAWSGLVDCYASLVFGTVRRMGLTREQAADVSQAVWIALYERRETIRDPRALPRWLIVTARRLALKELRQRGAGDQPLDPEVEDSVPTVEDLLAREERATVVRTALDRLPDRCRVLLLRLFREDRPDYQEVSREFSLPIGSIGPTRARCLARLYRLLRREGHEF